MSTEQNYLTGKGFRKYRGRGDLYSEPGLIVMYTQSGSIKRCVRDFDDVKSQLLQESRITFNENGGGETVHIFIKYEKNPNKRKADFAIIHEEFCKPELVMV